MVLFDQVFKVIILLCAYASVCTVGRIRNDSAISAVFIFGDSFVDQGNNNYVNTLAKANFHPYGIDFLGGKPTGRCTNARNLPDFLAATLGVKDYIPAYLEHLITDKDLQTGVSFASAGSGFDPQTTTITTAIPMSVQLEMFKEYIGKLKRNIEEKAVDNIITNSVVFIVSGNNDLLFSLPVRSLQYDVPGYANMLVKLVLNFTQEIHMLGVRRIGVFGAPPIGCLPALRTLGGGILRACSETQNNIAQLYNTILKQQLQAWATSVPESKVTYIDFYSILRSIVEKHHEYGFDVADRGCCGTGEIEVSYTCNKLLPICPDRSKFLFWDGFHLSEKGYSIFSNHISDDLVNNL